MKELQLDLGECSSSFNMERAVCNHGFFMMPPNVWSPSTKSLCRPLRLADSSHSLSVTISHPSNKPFLVIKVDVLNSLSSADEAAILEQVARMLRISKKDEKDVREFQALHGLAKEKGFGRIFRSPSLFEDAVKSILLSNCRWERTLSMAQALCDLQAEIAKFVHSKRKRIASNSSMKIFIKRLKHNEKYMSKEGRSSGNFPTWKELAWLDNQEFLKKQCNLGYRAEIILRLAKIIEKGELDLEPDKTLYGKLRKIKDFGPFICSNIMMCVGFYNRIPSDTETFKHLKKVHGKENCSRSTVEKDVEEIYGKYTPFQCMAYWMEMVDEYENRFGTKLSELDRGSYHLVTGSSLIKEPN